MEFDEWVEEYQPVKNDIVDGASCDGFMFETHGEEYNRVYALANELATKDGEKNNGYHVWTLVSGEGVDFVSSGWHFVNRLGYFITKKPWKEGEHIEVTL